jgi:hypothetical protein
MRAASAPVERYKQPQSGIRIDIFWRKRKLEGKSGETETSKTAPLKNHKGAAPLLLSRLDFNSLCHPPWPSKLGDAFDGRNAKRYRRLGFDLAMSYGTYV